MDAVELKSVLERLQAAERSLRKLANNGSGSGGSNPNGGLGGAIESMAEPKDFTGMETASKAPLGVMGPQRTPGGNVSLPAAGGMPAAPQVQPQQRPLQPAVPPLGQKPLATSTDPTVTLPSQRPMPNRTPAGMTALSKSAFELPQVSPTVLNAGAGGLLGAGLGAAAGGLHHYMQDEEDRDPDGVTSSLLSGGLMGGIGGAALGGYTNPFFSTEADSVRAPGPRPVRTPSKRELKVPEKVKRWSEQGPAPYRKTDADRGQAANTLGSGATPRLSIPGPVGALLGGLGTLGMQQHQNYLRGYDDSIHEMPVPDELQPTGKKTSALKRALIPQPAAPQQSWWGNLYDQSIFGGKVRPLWTSQAQWGQQQQRQQQQAASAARYPAPAQPTPQALQQAQANATQLGKENPLPMRNHWLGGQVVDEAKAREQSVARNTQHRANAAQAGSFRGKALDADVDHAQSREFHRTGLRSQAAPYQFKPSGAQPWSQAAAPQPAAPKPPQPLAQPKPMQQPAVKTSALYSQDAALYGLGGAGIGAAMGGLDYAFDDKKDEEDSPSLAMRMLASGGMGGLGGAMIGSHINDRVSGLDQQLNKTQKSLDWEKGNSEHWLEKARKAQAQLDSIYEAHAKTRT